MTLTESETVNDLRSPNTPINSHINSQANRKNADFAMFRLVVALILGTVFVCCFLWWSMQVSVVY